jgi:hypothetical protein
MVLIALLHRACPSSLALQNRQVTRCNTHCQTVGSQDEDFGENPFPGFTVFEPNLEPSRSQHITQRYGNAHLLK